MKNKPGILHTLRNLLILLAVLLVVVGVAFAVLFYCSCVRLNEEDRMIHAVRYIGLAQPGGFYEEVMGCPDGYLQASMLNTKLPVSAAADDPAAPGSYAHHVGGPEHFRPYAGRVYVKKEGDFLCVAVVTTPEWSILHPGRTNWSERFKICEQADPGSGRTVYCTADGDRWKIDAADMLQNGVLFCPPDAPSTQGTEN